MQKLQNDADAYAPTLLQVAKLVLHRPLTSLGLVGILESHSSLRRRIERLLDFHPPRTPGLTLGSALSVLAFGALALPMGQAPVTETRDGGAPVLGLPATIPTTNATNALASNAANIAIPAVDPPSEDVDTQKAKNAALVREARAMFEVGKVKAAKKNLKEVLEHDPQNLEALYYLNLVDEAEFKKAFENRDVIIHPIPLYSVTNNPRNALVAKLGTIRFDRVQFDDLTLDAVVRFLENQTRRLDPEQQGIHFIISPESDDSDPGSTRSGPGDVAAVRIRILPALTDVRLDDVLHAIVKVADRPIQYSVEDHAVVFAWKRRSLPLYTRIIKVNPDTFNQGMESALGASSARLGPGRVAREFFEKVGVDLDPPKSVFFNDREGTLLVHATLADLDRVEAVVQVLDIPPPQVNIKVRFFEVPEEIAGPLWRQLNPTNPPTDKASALMVGLTAPQWSVLRKSLESSSGVEFVNEASVTTLRGRQFEVQLVELKNIATNLNPHALQPPGISSGTEAVYLEGQISFGPILDAIATASLSNDKWQIQLNATASLTELSYYDRTNHFRVYIDGKRKSVPFAIPHFRSMKMPINAVMYDGQTLVIGSQTDEDPHGTERLGHRRNRLLAVITPTLIDSSGN
jgi:tetratricopeptide (TPR) repeat protein